MTNGPGDRPQTGSARPGADAGSRSETGEAERTVDLAVDARGVATLTLTRPARHNAMNAAMMSALAAAAADLAARPGVRAVVLTGEGASFCAGGDLGWMRAQTEADRATRMAEAHRLAEMLHVLDTLPLPLIARVQGPAYGGGVGLISVADVAVAAAGARFGLTETRLGLIPATIAPYTIARMGPARAREVFASSRVFSAEEAVRLGLIARVVAPEDLDRAVEAEVAPYLGCAPGAVAAAKALRRRLSGAPGEAEISITIEALADQWETEEARVGIAAFFARHPPPWVTPRD